MKSSSNPVKSGHPRLVMVNRYTEAEERHSILGHWIRKHHNMCKGKICCTLALIEKARKNNHKHHLDAQSEVGRHEFPMHFVWDYSGASSLNVTLTSV